MSEAIQQAMINELVERFYDKLTKIDYFSNMFAERGVDIEHLKERQRVFLMKLANENSQTENLEKVQHAHSFQVTKESGQLWMDTMKETIMEMDWSPEQKQMLTDRIQILLNGLVNR